MRTYAICQNALRFLYTTLLPTALIYDHKNANLSNRKAPTMVDAGASMGGTRRARIFHQKGAVLDN